MYLSYLSAFAFNLIDFLYVFNDPFESLELEVLSFCLLEEDVILWITLSLIYLFSI